MSMWACHDDVAKKNDTRCEQKKSPPNLSGQTAIP